MTQAIQDFAEHPTTQKLLTAYPALLQEQSLSQKPSLLYADRAEAMAHIVLSSE
jgi:hypothetical protein